MGRSHMATEHSASQPEHWDLLWKMSYRVCCIKHLGYYPLDCGTKVHLCVLLNH